MKRSTFIPKRRTVSMCPTADWCRGYNSAIEWMELLDGVEYIANGNDEYIRGWNAAVEDSKQLRAKYEQPQRSDRQKILDFLDELETEHLYKVQGYAESYSQYNEAWRDAIDRVRSFVENMRSGEHQQ